MPRLLIVLLAVASVVSTSAPANAEDDPWWGEDKALHFSFSAVIAAGGYGVAVPFSEERWHRALFGGGLAVTAGAAKEGYDATGAGSPSYRDFTWDVVGAATGVGLALLLDWALSSKGDEPSQRSPMRSSRAHPLPAADSASDATQYAARRWLSAK